MRSTDFCYWLQGYFELSPESRLTADQIKIIRAHINLVKKCAEPPKQEEAPATDFMFDDSSDTGSHYDASGEVLFKC